MKIFYSLKKNVVESISHSPFAGSKEAEIDEDEIGEVYVVDVRSNGSSIEFFGFEDEEEAEETFLNIASEKFSNWDEYSPEDIKAVLENGCEKTSGGSVCICRVS